jgi:hypothetical protein
MRQKGSHTVSHACTDKKQHEVFDATSTLHLHQVPIQLLTCSPPFRVQHQLHFHKCCAHRRSTMRSGTTRRVLPLPSWWPVTWHRKAPCPPAPPLIGYIINCTFTDFERTDKAQQNYFSICASVHVRNLNSTKRRQSPENGAQSLPDAQCLPQ